MAKMTHELLDEMLKRAPGGNDILQIIRIGKATPPQREEDRAKYEAARKIAELSDTLIGKSALRSALSMGRLALAAENFKEKFPDALIQEA